VRLRIWIVALGAAVAAALSHAGAAEPAIEDRTIVHVLNRIGFGARPGDVERVRQLGIRRYLDEQLHPDRIPDAALQLRLAHLPTVGLSAREISERFEQPLIQARRERKQQAAQPPDSDPRRQAAIPAERQANLVIVELAEQKLLRAIYSDRQLHEVLADFWFNHFNVDARKGRGRFLLTEYERETIRPHVLGRFRDMLGATARSPAMLFYLDNWLSADPNGPHPIGARQARVTPGGRRSPGFPPRVHGAGPAPEPPRDPARPAPGSGRGNVRRNGLNENFARELMELHTLGVDGGYRQKDVTEVARAFTGWTIDSPRLGAQFRFEPRIHDDGEKVILGHRIRAGGGRSDGERVLDILAAHPSTARFISTKLARRFVSDTPPPALVERLAARFAASSGDLRAVTTELLTSPEFVAPESYRSKVKSPFEFVASAVRATGANLPTARGLVGALQDLGQPLYQCQPPTGYKDTADAWTSAGALVNRMNFALSLASGRLPQPADPRGRSHGGRDRSSAEVAAWADSVERALARDLSETTRATIAMAASAPERAALALGSPEFQRK
jgi:uncharacterized protein (DUF1800 family)